MTIPILYTVFRDGVLLTGPVHLEEGVLVMDAPEIPLGSASVGSDERSPVIIADVDGLNKGELCDRVLTQMRMPGHEIWYLTHIESITDVFDGFMTNASKIVIPYHTVLSPAVLEEAYELSDECIPAVFVSDGMAVTPGNGRKNLHLIMKELMAIGYADIMLFDMDGSVTKEDWIDVRRDLPSTIPYVFGKHAGSGIEESLCFDRIIVEYLH